jgi:hypothetical protein
VAKTPNPQIGDCPCPVRGCDLDAKVYRFKRAGDGFTRFAGKLYLDCPTHGRFGGDGREAAQEYILEHAKIWGAEREAKTDPKPEPVAETVPEPTPAPAPLKAKKTPEPTPEPVKKPTWLDAFRDPLGGLK